MAPNKFEESHKIDDAPVDLDNAESWAWLSGWNAAVERGKTLLKLADGNKMTYLMRYGHHDEDCRVYQVGKIHATRDDCSCGLWNAIGLPADWRPYVKE